MVFIFLIGVMVGMTLSSIYVFVRLKMKTRGYLRIDRSDPSDKPYMFLELSDNLNTLSNKKFVTLQIKNENFISQK